LLFHKDPIAEHIQAYQRSPTHERLNVISEQLRPYATAFVRRYLSDPEDVEDVVQDALTKATRDLRSLQEARAWKHWLQRIAQGCVCDCLQTKERQQPRASDAVWRKMRGDFMRSHNDLFHRRFPAQEAAWDDICRLLCGMSRLAFLHRAYFENSTQNVMLSEVKDWLREFLDEREQTFSEMDGGDEEKGLEMDALITDLTSSEDPAEIVARRLVIDHCFAELNDP
jgi:DNA-directed RNA polymerase specialized sigma24 family protein